MGNNLLTEWGSQDGRGAVKVRDSRVFYHSKTQRGTQSACTNGGGGRNPGEAWQMERMRKDRQPCWNRWEFELAIPEVS